MCHSQAVLRTVCLLPALWLALCVEPTVLGASLGWTCHRAWCWKDCPMQVCSQRAHQQSQLCCTYSFCPALLRVLGRGSSLCTDSQMPAHTCNNTPGMLQQCDPASSGKDTLPSRLCAPKVCLKKPLWLGLICSCPGSIIQEASGGFNSMGSLASPWGSVACSQLCTVPQD